ncbi:glycoside hydrolase family 16 protein [Coprinopsis marcescibilis]|uniref:Glycoside hydrolase family 16 protein n=1 Tax=Coprinopsis marcescibilis TaxID=230819 RepID=A0A5C3KW67_COPMA|nr:glycoside hydrolase family 16 protein [Coprinopsis marcescibilis]
MAATSGTSSGASSESNSLRQSPSSSSLYKASAAASASLPRNSSTHSFRAAFLAPSSRPSSTIWTPPQAQFVPSALGQDPAASTAFLSKSRPPMTSTRLTAPLTKDDKPWLSSRQPKTYTSYFLTLFCIFLGLCGAAALCYFGYTEVNVLDPSRLCLEMDEQFTGGLNPDYWNVEIQTGGFGNGEFQMTSDSSDNLFVRNNQLYIHPTLTTEALPDVDIFNGGNRTLPGCTADDERASCTASSNNLLGAVIPPAISARINTKGKKSIRYGKVEIRAKLPKGDWLWPAVWMLPQDNRYGAWPMSGEIDLVEARGNDQAYKGQGRNFVRSSLNYGPLPSLYTQIYGWQSLKRSSFDQAFHTYTLEWTPEFIRMFVDKRLYSMLEVDKLRADKTNFWARGKYPQVATNWTADNTGNGEMVVVNDIWKANDGAPNAPFDQPFYLIANLAVGGTSGWFPDGTGEKAWYDKSQTAMRDFALDQARWARTWGGVDDRSLRLDSVKMWSLCR